MNILNTQEQQLLTDMQPHLREYEDFLDFLKNQNNYLYIQLNI